MSNIKIYKSSESIVINNQVYNSNICISSNILYDPKNDILKALEDFNDPYIIEIIISDNIELIKEYNEDVNYLNRIVINKYTYLCFDNNESRDNAYDYFFLNKMADTI